MILIEHLDLLHLQDLNYDVIKKHNTYVLENNYTVNNSHNLTSPFLGDFDMYLNTYLSKELQEYPTENIIASSILKKQIYYENFEDGTYEKSNSSNFLPIVECGINGGKCVRNYKDKSFYYTQNNIANKGRVKSISFWHRTDKNSTDYSKLGYKYIFDWRPYRYNNADIGVHFFFNDNNYNNDKINLSDIVFNKSSNYTVEKSIGAWWKLMTIKSYTFSVHPNAGSNGPKIPNFWYLTGNNSWEPLNGTLIPHESNKNKINFANDYVKNGDSLTLLNLNNNSELYLHNLDNETSVFNKDKQHNFTIERKNGDGILKYGDKFGLKYGNQYLSIRTKGSKDTLYKNLYSSSMFSK